MRQVDKNIVYFFIAGIACIDVGLFAFFGLAGGLIGLGLVLLWFSFCLYHADQEKRGGQ